MYKVTVEKKESYEKITLKYECFKDASVTMEDILAGDLNNEIAVTLEIEKGEE